MSRFTKPYVDNGLAQNNAKFIPFTNFTIFSGASWRIRAEIYVSWSAHEFKILLLFCSVLVRVAPLCLLCLAMVCSAMLCYALRCFSFRCASLRPALLCYPSLCFAMIGYALRCFVMLRFDTVCCILLCFAQFFCKSLISQLDHNDQKHERCNK